MNPSCAYEFLSRKLVIVLNSFIFFYFNLEGAAYSNNIFLDWKLIL